MRRELDIHGLRSQIFRRIVDIPFDACLAALDSWQRTGQDGELHLGHGLRGPIERDRETPAHAGSRSAWPANRCASRCS